MPRRRRHLHRRRPRPRRLPHLRHAQRRGAPGRRWPRQGPLRRRTGRGWSWPRPGPRPSTPPSPSSSTTSRCPPWSTPRRRWPTARRSQFDELGSNLAAGQRDDDGSDPLADADVVVRGRFVNQRIAVVPMEGNAIAVIPAADGTATARRSTSSDPDAAPLPATGRRRARPDPGRRSASSPPTSAAAFGGKAGIAAEHAVGRRRAPAARPPGAWVETRSENMLAMPHGRGQVQYVELGFDRDGTITGLRAARRRRRRRVRRVRRRPGHGADPH